MRAEQLATRLPGGASRNSSGWWSGLCPGHPESNPSFSFREGDRRLILHCFAGCTSDRIATELAALLEITVEDLHSISCARRVALSEDGVTLTAYADMKAEVSAFS